VRKYSWFSCFTQLYEEMFNWTGYVGFVPSDRGAFFVDRSVTEHHFQKPILDFLYHRFHLIIEIKKERILFKLHADTITHKVDQGSDLVKAETQSLQKILLSKRVHLSSVLELRSKSFKP
jgi:hypothetical protein